MVVKDETEIYLAKTSFQLLNNRKPEACGLPERVMTLLHNGKARVQEKGETNIDEGFTTYHLRTKPTAISKLFSIKFKTKNDYI